MVLRVHTRIVMPLRTVCLIYIFSEYNYQTNYFGFTTLIYTLKITPRIINSSFHFFHASARFRASKLNLSVALSLSIAYFWQTKESHEVTAWDGSCMLWAYSLYIFALVHYGRISFQSNGDFSHTMVGCQAELIIKAAWDDMLSYTIIIHSTRQHEF